MTTKKNSNSRDKVNWLKSHPLEGDGTLVNLFHYLWKKNRDLQSCPLVRVPGTIVYEHNFPRGWYLYDGKHTELRKKTGKELDTNSIFREFSKAEDENVEIVASYLSKTEDEGIIYLFILSARHASLTSKGQQKNVSTRAQIYPVTFFFYPTTETGEEITQVEYFDKNDLSEFHY